MSKYEERLLENNYPVFADYIYVVDNQVRRSPLSGTVADLKRHYNAAEVRACDLVGRGLIK